MQLHKFSSLTWAIAALSPAAKLIPIHRGEDMGIWNHKTQGIEIRNYLMFNAKLATPQVEFYNLGVCPSLSLQSPHSFLYAGGKIWELGTIKQTQGIEI